MVTGALALEACGSDAPSGPVEGGSGVFRVALPAVGQTVAIPNAGLGRQGIAVTRLATSSVVAVSRRCTHQGCTVNLPASQGGNLNCPCHGSAFTVQGSVVNGPAQSPLLSYPAEIDADAGEVVVTVA